MIIIFDLDYTLLDTEKFNKDIAKSLGISIKKYNEIRKKHFSDKKIKYDPYKLIKILQDGKHIDSVKNYREKINRLVENVNSYLFPKALEVVKKFKKRGDKIILMSVGDKAWQKQKIGNLKIKKYFDDIVIIKKEKYKNLDFLKKEKEKILIINDNAGETFDMKKAIGNCEICLIQGPYSRNVKHNLKIYNIEDCLELYD
jgi:FMN phosphatase YigB (HAD superfamily)